MPARYLTEQQVESAHQITHRQGDKDVTSIATCRLNHNALTRNERAVLFRLLNHPLRDPVLDRTTRAEELDFADYVVNEENTVRLRRSERSLFTYGGCT